ncbi:NifU N-terminal domain-containing protein, partial [Staphylococcus ureilyticus]|nr:NifU N-terminal domain-containing protein [Staphylococcus ureilyticus]
VLMNVLSENKLSKLAMNYNKKEHTIMEIINIATTPNPNTMKIDLNIDSGDNKPNTYTKVKEGQPDFINAVLDVEGVKSIFQAMNFISVDKNSEVDWDTLLPNITKALEEI